MNGRGRGSFLKASGVVFLRVRLDHVGDVMTEIFIRVGSRMGGGLDCKGIKVTIVLG